MTYSQGDEEEWILKLLPDDGRFLDIGAYDGRAFSNTRALAQKGWAGVWVEPAAWAFDGAVSNRIEGVDLVNCLLGPRTELVPFHYTRDALSTTSAEFAHQWSGTAEYVQTWVPMIAVSDFLATFPGPYHFIDIDTEGTTTQILDLLKPRLESLDTQLLCVEHDAPFTLPGFRCVHVTSNNAIWERR